MPHHTNSKSVVDGLDCSVCVVAVSNIEPFRHSRSVASLIEIKYNQAEYLMGEPVSNLRIKSPCD